MKRLAWVTSLLLCILCTVQAKDRVIERPPFLAWSSSSIEVDKIVMSNTVTTVYVKAFYRPKNWIKIAKGSFLKDNNETGGVNLDFESVYSYGSETDYWRLLVSHTGDYSYAALKDSDSRYTDFKAYKEQKVIYCNLRQKPFYENTPVEPEVVLADLIKAFHPHLLPDYQPVYYEMLTR